MKSLQTVCLLFASAGLVAAQQYTISTIAGVPGVAGLYPAVNDATKTPATSGQLYQPTRVAVDSKGNFYISDYLTHVVRMVTASTGNISTIAGNGAAGFAGDGAAGNQANITDVHGIAADGNGNVYISDTSNNRIRKIDSTGIITTYAGNGTRAYAGDGGTALAASLWYPGGLAIDGSGNLYVADYGSSTVRKITSGGTISTVAGTGSWGFSGDGGAGPKAALAFPTALTLDAAGNLYIGDVGNNNIRKVDSSGNISTVVTSVTPQGLAVDAAGNFYFVDGVSSGVRKVLPGGGVVTIAGSGQAGYSGDGGPASVALLSHPTGLAMAPSGNIYVADTGNDIIRQLTPVAASLGVQDAASGLPGSIAPGEILTLFGTALGPPALTKFTLGANGLFPTQIAGTSVTFNGTPAPLIYTSAGVVAAIAPYEISNSASASVVLTYLGNTFTASSVPVVATAPSLFTANSSGSGPAAALNQDLSVNSAANPAKAGSTIVLYVTGEGLTNAPVNGKPAGSTNLPKPFLPVTVKIGNQIVTPTYFGGAPTLVAGVMQVNVQVPAGILSGLVQVQVLVGGYPSQAGVTIAVTQ